MCISWVHCYCYMKCTKDENPNVQANVSVRENQDNDSSKFEMTIAHPLHCWRTIIHFFFFVFVAMGVGEELGNY